MTQKQNKILSIRFIKLNPSDLFLIQTILNAQKNEFE